ncbi:low molecular weight protein-tyrosine-phosphatase [Stutzerimonas azotifigens]|uniref:low molecular weight protein-tyrosine-phosphatase n=1 Tax=Stutzerimonas azotifigens TaxID=291995 RepID=UPI0003FA75D3|nr:low molecular weight protein-tyrosine-phosphatase [Stutzerimonas azotifigens]
MHILFVCLGNICRSPTAEAVFRHRVEAQGLAERIFVDSAGTGGWHVGKAPDARTCAAGARRGYRLSHLRARQFESADFQRFDLILAMDRANLEHLEALRPEGASAQLDLFLRRYELSVDEVPDPYYGGPEGFERVIDLIEQGSERLLDDVRRVL